MQNSSITFGSNTEWLMKWWNSKVSRYIRRNHKRADRPIVEDLIVSNPDEGRKLCENHDLTDEKKIELLLNFLLSNPQITCGIFADQRMGKDALICTIFEMCLYYCEEKGINPPRIVTLGNLRKPPFVADEDMYFSFKSIPIGSKDQEVWIYCSEIETVLPAREGTSPENRLFSQLEGTMAQNHQKLFGCCKLASKVDLNFIRGMNVKLFKFISPEKLGIEGVERVNIISPLGKWLLPKNPNDKSEVLMVFDNQLLSVHIPLPTWWTDQYSEQFRDVPLDKIKDYISVVHSNGMNVPSIQIAIAQKFRRQMSKKEIEDILGSD